MTTPSINPSINSGHGSGRSPLWLYWWNAAKRPLEMAVKEASAAHARRLGSEPTNVILPLGEYPAEVGGLRVETCLTVKGLFMKVYRSEAPFEGPQDAIDGN